MPLRYDRSSSNAQLRRAACKSALLASQAAHQSMVWEANALASWDVSYSEDGSSEALVIDLRDHGRANPPTLAPHTS